MIDYIIQFVTTVATATGLVVLILKFFGTTLWAHALNKRLEAFKAEETRKLEEFKAEEAKRLEGFKQKHAEQIASLRFRLDAAMAGGLKLQEKEFEVYPKLWTMLDEVHGRFLHASSSVQKLPPIADMSEIQLEEVLAMRDWLETQKEQVRRADDPADVFSKIDRQYNFGRAQKCLAEFETFFIHNKVFFKEPLKSHVVEMNKEFWNVHTNLFMYFQARDGTFFIAAGEGLRDKVTPLLTQVEDEITKHLRAMNIEISPPPISTPST
jgi:hypothetical protein